MGKIELKNIDKSYGRKEKVVENFNLSVDDGEFIVLLGSSGCGKSTLLRIIAGLEDVDSGEIYIDENFINNKEPKDRDVAMVFQNYALYPHMTVYKNIAINQILRKENKDVIRDKVLKVARILDIEQLLTRKPKELSGGQMQRVALARAMIREPKVFLMDEPLSNLDSKLRVQTRAEIMKLYGRLKTSMIYVTHDQVEAMTMATTIVLMNKGKIMQKGTPDELYNKPQNKFSAEFIGTPQMNFFPSTILNGEIEVLNQKYYIDSKGTVCNEFIDSDAYMENNVPVWVGIRSEKLELCEGQDYIVELVENLGNEKFVYLKRQNNEISGYMDTEIKEDNIHKEESIAQDNVVVRISVDKHIKVSDRFSIRIVGNDLHVFHKNSENRINS